jgi:LacI family transcriptional regulator
MVRKVSGVSEKFRERSTIHDIAAEANVSVATISRIVRERGYSVNRSARNLQFGRTGLVGLLVPLVHPNYFSTIVAGVTEALNDYDLRAILSPTEHKHDREVTLLDRLMHGMADGALVVLPEESNAELERLLDSDYHFVVIDPRLSLNDRIPAVSAANASGADQVTRHLLELGHRRIAAITGPRDWQATEERRRGYHAALASAGILPDTALEIEADFEIHGADRAAQVLLDRPDPPTAIFAFNDNLAIGTIQAARAYGLRVPEDLSVVGFDDSEHASLITPALTTVRQPLAEMGRTAVNLLRRLIDGQRVETLHVELGTRLVVRDSTARPRS